MKGCIKNKLALLIALILFASSASGCLSLLPLSCMPGSTCSVTVPLPTEPSAQATASPSPAPTLKPSPAPTETVSPTPDPTPSPAPTQEPAAPTDTPPIDEAVRQKAVALAAEHDIPEERLFGQYELFLRYTETVEGNTSLGKYKEYVIRAFPALADNARYLDEDHFFPRLESLVISEIDPTDDFTGVYYLNSNEIQLALESPDAAFFTIYHELMHFFDHSIAEETWDCYVLQGKVLSKEEYDALSGSDALKARPGTTSKFYSDFMVEAGAELFTAKYFTGAPTSYTQIVSLLVGIEYIYGTDTVKAIFFSPDSSLLMAGLIQDLGYTYTDLLNMTQYLSWLADPENYYEPKHFSLEDLLIEMYEKNLEGDWRDDMRFRYILACMNGIGEYGYQSSKYSDELEKTDFISFTQYEVFEQRLISSSGMSAYLYCIPPIPIIDGDSFLLCAACAWRDTNTNEFKSGSLQFDYDFDTKTVNGVSAVELFYAGS